MSKLTFFISRTGSDRHWADLISDVVKELGHGAYHQDQDFHVGTSIMQNMADGTKLDCTIAVLSEAYLKSKHCMAEIWSALNSDPIGSGGRIIPVLVSRCQLPPLLKHLIYLNLVDVDEIAARQKLLEVLREHRVGEIVPSVDTTTTASIGNLASPIRGSLLSTSTPDISEEAMPEPIDSDNVQTDQFSAAIKNRMAKLNRKVEKLTGEQFRVIRQLMGCHRVRISGCAGSGKTLVAAEKANRSAEAGYSTLFLCHSPLLADNVRQMTDESGVRVEDFGEWIRRLAGEHAQDVNSSWTNYHEPDSELLGKALDSLLASVNRFDCVVVDEGQDFREEWWTVVEASLKDSKNSTLYIFHDDNQAILPFRSTYPIAQPVIDLSRNCRNGGKVFDLMKVLCPGAPAAERQLKDAGAARLFAYDRDNESGIISNAIAWLLSEGFAGDATHAAGNIVALHGGTTPIENSPLIGTFPAGIIDWQGSVHDEFKRAIDLSESLTPPHGGWAEIERILKGLSSNHYPSAADIELVRRIAKAFSVDSNTRRLITNRPGARAGLSWILTGSKAKLSRSGFGSFRASEIIVHFERNTWHESLPVPQNFTLAAYNHSLGLGHIPVYRVADYKGLESDCILLLVEGTSPFLMRELYVGISRARRLLAFLLDRPTIASLPRGLRPRWGSDTE